MTHKRIRLIAADMDGTLLDHEGKLPEAFFDTERRMREAGITFVAASGRQYFNLLKLFDRIKDGIIFVAENGTYVVDKGRELFTVEVPAEQAYEVIMAVRGIDNAYPVLCGKNSAYIEDTLDEFVRQARTYYERCEIVPDLLKVTGDKFLKIAIYDFDDTDLNSYPKLKHFNDRLKVVVSGKHWVDVSNQDANKGNALRHIQKMLGIRPDECVAFGDQMNDAEMLQSVGLGYAMANASPELKAIAGHVAPSNKDNGVITTINSLLYKF